MLTGTQVILILKIAVLLVTVLLIVSLVALAKGNTRLHGRINTIFFVLTVLALLGLEVVARIVDPNIFDFLDQNPQFRQSMQTHLTFSIPSALVMP